MSKATESSEPNSSVGQHGDPNTLDVFAELEKSGVKGETESTDSSPATEKTSQESQGKTDDASPVQKPDVKPEAKKSDTKQENEGKGAPRDVEKTKSQKAQDSKKGSSKQEKSVKQEKSAKKEKSATEDDAEKAPSTALLFQPPDLSSVDRKPRRASAPAGPPRVHDDAPRKTESPSSVQQSKQDELPKDSADKGSASAGQGSDADQQSDRRDSGGDSEQNQRRRRRRGGRGRRGRGGNNNGSGNNGSSNVKNDNGDHPQESSSAKSGDASVEESRSPSKGNGSKNKQDSASSGKDSKSSKPDQGSESSQRTDDEKKTESSDDANSDQQNSSSSRRRRRRRRAGTSSSSSSSGSSEESGDGVTAPRGSTRLEAKRQRRREGRESGRRKPVITEAEFLARRESVNREMMVREREGRMQIGLLEDNVLVEHYVSRETNASIVGNVYVGKVQNVLPSMEAAFVDIGKGRNAVLYAGEVNWDAAGLEGDEPRRIEQALNSGDHVLVQVTKDPIGHKGARLTAQISLAGRFLVFVPSGSMTGISRKLPDSERSRLKKILKEIVPEGGGVIVRTAAEGASEEELRSDIERLQKRWTDIESAQKGMKKSAGPKLVHSEADMAIRVVRDIFNEDFERLVVSGDQAWSQISNYVEQVAPDLMNKLEKWTSQDDIFAANRIDEQLAKAMDRKVFLPSGGSLVIDRTEAMTVVDVNTGRFTGTGGTLEETVTKNNLEAAEEVVRQLRLRDIGGIIVIDFIDMVLEQNRDLVMRRLVECLGRDRTKHQVAEVTSLGLVQMTRKRVGQGLVEAFSEKCEHCSGRGYLIHDHPVEKSDKPDKGGKPDPKSDKNNSDDDSNKNRGDNNGRRNRRKKSGSHDNSRDNSRNGKSSNSGGAKPSENSQNSSEGDGSKSGSDSSQGNKSHKQQSRKNTGETQDSGARTSETHASGTEGNAAPSETPEEVRAALAAIAAAAVQSHEKNEGSADAQQQKSDAKIEDNIDGKESSSSTSEG